MDPRIFLPQPMGLAGIVAGNPRPNRSARIARFLSGEPV
jgi:hypothetical protein